GHESYAYDWSEHKAVDSSQPLTVLNHVGGSPLLAFVGRTKYQPQNYQMLVKWVKLINQRFEEMALPRLDEGTRAQYEEFAKILHPVLKRIDKATSELLLPALADGQMGLVLDAQMTSKQWHQMMPASDKPLPILEPAIIVGVSDAAKL